MLIVNWLLDRKVESFGDMDSTIAESPNVYCPYHQQILPSFLVVSLLQASSDPAIALSMSPTDSTFLSSCQLTTSIHW
jgi:hypothetical protein